MRCKALSALTKALPLAAVMAACTPAVPGDTTEASPADSKPADAPRPSDKADKANWFAVEEAMGADCGGGAITEAPLGDTACSGQLPEHLARFLRNIPQGHPFLTPEARLEASRTRSSFKAVSGMGRRPDFVAVIEHVSSFWIRSFEGPDQDTTIYLVYGPECESTPSNQPLPPMLNCLAEEAYMRDFKLYRVHRGGPPQDVTEELSPPAPILTPAERARFGIYLHPEYPAKVADAKLDVSRLAYVPVMRWILRPVQEGDYQPPPMPASDPRAFKDPGWRDHAAHFGFLVWTGERFELHETVSAALWPCRTGRPDEHVCSTGYDIHADRYIEHADPSGSVRAAP